MLRPLAKYAPIKALNGYVVVPEAVAGNTDEFQVTPLPSMKDTVVVDEPMVTKPADAIPLFVFCPSTVPRYMSAVSFAPPACG